MSKIDNIINKLSNDADETIAEINAQADKEIQTIKNRIAADTKSKKARILEEGKHEADRAYQKIISAGELKARNLTLGAEQELINKVLKMASDKKAKQSDDDFIASIKSALSKISEDEEIIVKVPPRRKAAVDQADLNVAVEEDASIDEGFVVESHRMVYNFKTSDMLEDNRADIELDIINSVFNQ